MISQAQKQ